MKIAHCKSQIANRKSGRRSGATLTAAQVAGYRNRRIDLSGWERPVVCRATGERWASMARAARALGYRHACTIAWHVKQGTPARGGRVLECEGRRSTKGTKKHEGKGR